MLISNNTGSKKAIAYAYIMVTYPEGSTCTAECGTITLAAPDTSGSVVFTIKKPGEYTVTCTDGADTEYQVVNVELNHDYVIELAYVYWLYNLARGINRLGTMQQGQEETTCEFDSNGLLVQTKLCGGHYPKYSDGTFNLNGYNKLYITSNWFYHAYSQYGYYLGFCSNVTGSYRQHTWHTYAELPYAQNPYNKYMCVDLSSETRIGYFYIFGTGDDGGNTTVIDKMYITELYLSE